MSKKQNHKLATETDWIVANESKIKDLHSKYKKDTGDKTIPFIAFADYIYNNAQDLVVN
jgi:hypothetical protein